MRICSVEGCNKRYVSKGLCSKHYTQLLRLGKILERTRFDLNEIVCEKGICQMKLYDVYHKVVGKTTFDIIDLPRVQKHKWSLHREGNTSYVITNSSKLPKHHRKLHRLILNVLPNLGVDHRNRNGLDNCRFNLRLANQSFNIANSKLFITNTSKYRGVVWEKRRNKWIAQIMVNYRNIYLGSFINKLEAAKAYNHAAIRYFGNFAYLNKIPEEMEVFINV